MITHAARHTFATTVTLTKGVPIETVSKMLGHTNVKTTQIYARIIDTKISEDMNNLADKLKNIEPETPHLSVNNKSMNEKIDFKFECLTLSEKMELFNLPKTLSIDNEREKRISKLWYGISEEEKCSLWDNIFGKGKSDMPTPIKKVHGLAINH